MVVHLKQRALFSLSLVLLVVIVGLNFYAASPAADVGLFEQFFATSGGANLLTGAVVGTAAVPSEGVNILACDNAGLTDSFDGGPSADLETDFTDPPIGLTMALSGNEILINGTLFNTNLSDNTVSANAAFFMVDTMPVNGDFNFSMELNLTDTSSTFEATGEKNHSMTAGLILQDVDADEIISVCPLYLSNDMGGVTALFPSNDSNDGGNWGVVILGGAQDLFGNLSVKYDSTALEYNCSFTSASTFASSVLNFDLSGYGNIRPGFYTNIDLAGGSNPSLLSNATVLTAYNDFNFATAGTCAAPAAPLASLYENFNDALDGNFTSAVLRSAGINFELIANKGSFNGTLAGATGATGYRVYTGAAATNNNQSTTVYVNFTLTNGTYEATGTINQRAMIEYYNLGADDYYTQCGLVHNGAQFQLNLLNDSSGPPATVVPLGGFAPTLEGNLTLDYENSTGLWNCSLLAGGQVASGTARRNAIPAGTSVGLTTYFQPQGPFSYNGSANVTFENLDYNHSSGARVGLPAPPAPAVIVPLSSFYEDFSAMNTTLLPNAGAELGTSVVNNYLMINGTVLTSGTQPWARRYTNDSYGTVGANNFSIGVNVTFQNTNDTLAASTALTAGVDIGTDLTSNMNTVDVRCNLQIGIEGSITLMLWNVSGPPASTDSVAIAEGQFTLIYDNVTNLLTCTFLDSAGATSTTSASRVLSSSSDIALVAGMNPSGSPANWNGTVNATFDNWNYTNNYVPVGTPPSPPQQPLPSFYDNVGLATINTSFYDVQDNNLRAVINSNSAYEFSNGTLVNRTGPSSSNIQTVQNFSGGPGFELTAALFMQNLTNTYTSNGTLTSVWAHAQLGLQQPTSTNNVPYCSVSMRTNNNQLRLYNASSSPPQNTTVAPSLTGGNMSGNLLLTYDNQTNLLTCSFEGAEVTATYNLSAVSDNHIVFLGGQIGIEGPGGATDNYSLKVNVSFNDINFTYTELAIVCGNGQLQTGEMCDDGNTVSGDGCSATCQDESSGSSFAGCTLCPTNANQAACETSGASNCNGKCNWNDENSDPDFQFCEMLSCVVGDSTNQTFCESGLNSLYGLGCTWDVGPSYCNPLGGDFFGDNCNDFDSDECQLSPGCFLNSTGGCENSGTFSASFGNPSCGFTTTDVVCQNITGCSWTGAICNGHEAPTPPVQCSDIVDRGLCGDATFLSTCCSWSSGACTSSFENTCYDSIADTPPGANYCEDYNSFNNQTLCEQIAGSPWYMPCSWDAAASMCGFNGAAFGTGGGHVSFDDLNTESACEATGGVWRSENFVVNGQTLTDNWCEFNFAGGGNCDTACYACENNANADWGNSTAQAESACENSALGFCEFDENSNSLNGLGWCGADDDYIANGGGDCSGECGACQFLTSPEAECSASNASCAWENNTASPQGGYCYSAGDSYCGNDCFSCLDESTCVNNGEGGAGACSWAGGYCEPVGYNGENCFDGIDNDNDGQVDCLDPNCATSAFCGGESLSSQFGDCPSYVINTTCLSNGCVWLQDDFEATFGGANAGHCGYPGEQCWQYDVNSTACDATTGCTFQTGSFCEVNNTIDEGCFPQQNETACLAATGCGWVNITGGPSWCEPVMYSECHGNTTRQTSQALCESNVTVSSTSTQICAWNTNRQACEPVCFSKTNTTCSDGTNGLCEVISGLCEPDSFGGSCYQYDGNQTYCDGALNATCTYFIDSNAANNVSVTENPGWCDPIGDAAFISFIGNEPFEGLGSASTGDATLGVAAIEDTFDIVSVGIRDATSQLVLGTGVADNLANSSICNGVPVSGGGLGTGVQNGTFFWYLDSDGDTTNSCTVRGDPSQTGYEFSFKYQATYTSSLSELKVSYRCVSGVWYPTPIPLTTNAQIMCDLIGGGMAGIDESELFDYTEFNTSVDLRIYSTVSNLVTNDSFISDAIGPVYYSPGAIGFAIEDCSAPSGDRDGDGLAASNDPDCSLFLQKGFPPNEAGFLCADGSDNDGDNLVDCDDPGCESDAFFCGGSLVVDPTDRTAPSVVWQKVSAFPTSAFVQYDTNEPANGTLRFYNNDSSCATLNATVRDIGIVDPALSAYKLWHSAPIDSYASNPEALANGLMNATTYFYKTRVCDISGNCAVSRCENFTTKDNLAECSGCSTTFNFEATPLPGETAMDPTGNLSFVFIFPDGTTSSLTANAAAGSQFNRTQMSQFDLKVSNPTVAAADNWSVTFINASATGSVTSAFQNFTAGSDLNFNTTSQGDFVGLGATKCQEIINIIRPTLIEFQIPGSSTSLWQCDAALSSCVDKTAGATLIGTDATSSTWRFPAEWGC